MKEILQKWLYETVGIKLQIETLGKDLSDGIIFAKLLSSYRIVNERTIKHLLPSENPKVCDRNLREISIWFNILNIKFDEEIISQIIQGRATTCLKLLYELYTSLNDKKLLRFINFKKHRRSDQLSKKTLLCRRFLHDRTCSIIRRDTESEVFKQISCSPITEAEHVRRRDRSETKVTPIGKKDVLLDKMRCEDIRFVRNELLSIPRVRSSRKTDQSVSSSQFLLNEAQVKEHLKIENVKISKQSELEFERKLTQSSKSSALAIEAKSAENTEYHQLKTQITENILRQSDYEKQLTENKFKSDLKAEINQSKFLDIKKTIDNKSEPYEYYFSTCKTSEEEIAGQLEAIKKMELHRKLYNERIKKRNKKHLAIAKHIVHDLVNLAIKVSEYGTSPVPNVLTNKWKELLAQNKSILDDAPETSDKNIPVIDIDDKNIHIQTVTDDDFDDYNHLIGDWFDWSQEDVSYDDLFVLAHIVYRLQEAKLPPVIPLKPADITRYRVTSILNGTFNELQMIILKTLLVKPKICVVDVESTIRFCIERYKHEADIELPESTTKKNKKSKKPKSGTTDTTTSKKSKPGSKLSPTINTAYKDEEVQTTSSLLDTSIKPKELSTLAEIGKRLIDLQTFDDISVTDVTDILVEFLKTQSGIEGWVLVNFPSTLYEAYNLEKVLSGKKFPNVFQVAKHHKNESITSESSHRTLLDEEPDTTMIRSKLVYLPPKRDEEFHTYFTSFINVIKHEDPFSALPYYTTDTNTESKVDSASMSVTTVEINEEGEEVVDLNTIYKREGILKNINYKTMDFNTLKDVCRAILKCDGDLERTTSIEIFGEEVINRYYSDASIGTDGRQPTKATSKKSTNKKTPKGKDDVTLAKEFLEQLSISINKLATASEAVSQADDDQSPITQETAEEIIQLPSHDAWVYAEFPIADDDKIALANLWEEMENNYINKVKQVLQVNKTIQHIIPLYIKYIDETMANVYDSNENYKEKLVNDFLKHFNNIIETRHLDDDTLDQLSNDVFNMERHLWAISDERRNKSEQMRRHIIEQNWVARDMVSITNNYLTLFDIEAKRCNKTLEILYKYYSKMSFIQPQDDILHITSMDVSENECDLYNIKISLAKLLLDEKEMNLINPACDIVKRAVSHYFSEISQTKSDSDYVINIYDNFIKYRKEEYTTHEKQISTGDIYNFSKLKRESGSPETDKNILAFLETEDNKLTNLLTEWRYVVNAELDRLKWRINIINEKAIRDLDHLERQMMKVFYTHYNKIITSYFKENECIDNLCTIFHSAMKHHSPVRGDVIVDGTCVHIREVAKFSDIEHNHLINYQMRHVCFSVEQLIKLTNKLKCVIPNNVINKQTLRFIIEDIITYEQSPEHCRLFPQRWKSLGSREFFQLFEEAFGATSNIYWKNFILFCLDLHFPNIQDIIECKEQFSLYDKECTGTISYEDYKNITFWFQNDMNYIDNEDEQNLIKALLFSLFKVDEKTFGYVDFLLMFSKDESSAKGFGKALASLTAKSVIVSTEDTHLEEILTEYNDLLNNMIKDILLDTITNIVDDLEGVKIEELERESSEDPNMHTISEPLNRQSKKTLESEYEAMTESSETKFKLEKRKSIRDKESQTVSLTELLFDQYITKNKLYQWTTKMQTDLIITLLESYVFPVLNDDIVGMESTKRDLRQAIARLEHDGYVHVPLLMEETSIHNMFQQTRVFQTFSFPSAIKQKLNQMCLP